MNAADIRTELDQASQLDAEAREHRQRAGLMLRQAGAREIGIDPRMLELLLLMAPPNIPLRKR